MAFTHYDGIGNGEAYPGLPSLPAAAPKSAAQIVKEIALTGNPLAWLIMRMREPKYEFAPDYVYDGGQQTPQLAPPSHYGLRAYRVRDLHLDTGENVTAWYKKAEPGFPTVAYCHGNSGSLVARLAILKELGDRGFGVVIAAYPGFKQGTPHSKLSPCEAACVATGHAMVRYLVNRKHVPMEKIVLFGESLGTSVALQTAHLIEKGIPEYGYEPQNAPPVVCWAGFSSLVKRAKEQFPMLPASALMANRFESDKIIGDIEAPIMLMHGLEDDYTSYRHSLDLHQASGKKARLELLQGYNHNCTFPGTERQDPQRLRFQVDLMQDFLHELHMCPPLPYPLKNPVGQWEKRAESGPSLGAAVGL